MTDQLNPTEVPQSDPAPAAPSQPETPLKRVFQIGANRITEDEGTSQLSNEQVRKLLAAQYPEVANATIRETVSGGVRTVSYLAQPGRKG